MKRLLNYLMLVCLTVGVEAQQNVCIETSVSTCDIAPSIAFDDMSPAKVCRNTSVSKCIETIIAPGQVTTTTTQSPDCTETVNTDNNVQPTVVASYWYVQLGSYFASGSGLCAEFTPPKAGSGSIVYELEYSTGTACQGTGPNIHVTKAVPLEVLLETGLTITTQPVNQKVDLGEDVGFTVVAEGSPTSYQWYLRCI